MDELNIIDIPDKFYHVNRDGSFSDSIKENQRIENANYWARKQTQIGLLMLSTMGVLIIMLLNETDVLNFFWRMLWGG